MYIYVYIHVYIYIHTHTYCICICICTCICTRICTRTCIFPCWPLLVTFLFRCRISLPQIFRMPPQRLPLSPWALHCLDLSNGSVFEGKPVLHGLLHVFGRFYLVVLSKCLVFFQNDANTDVRCPSNFWNTHGWRWTRLWCLSRSKQCCRIHALLEVSHGSWPMLMLPCGLKWCRWSSLDFGKYCTLGDT